jgi:hypothetical protein
MAEIQLLRDPEVIPTVNVLENALGKEIYAVFEKMTNVITSSEFGLNLEWNFYKDGKAWLCKVTFKNKTVFWLSIWEKQIKIGFYFTEITFSGVFELPINESVKQSFKESKYIGKLIPLILSLEKVEQLNDLIEIINYKKGLK